MREGSSAKDPFNFDTDPDPGSALEKKDPNPDPDISLRFTECFFLLIFILKLDEPFRNDEIFIISLFSKVQIWDFGVKKIFFMQFLVDILSLGSGSVNPHIFADPDAKILRIQRIRILSTACFTGINAQITLKEKIINFQMT